jgi:hypothetical protein
MLFLYLDESGDLGFDFVNKRPSKFFVITILSVQGQQANRGLLKGVRRTVTRKLNPPARRSRIVEELKGTATTLRIKRYFYAQVRDIDFRIYSLILDKRRAFDYLADNKAEAYNHISKLLLEKVPFEQARTSIDLVVDRSKQKPEILAFNDYMKSQLGARINPALPFRIAHYDSVENAALQAADMFSYGIFEGYERERWEWFDLFKEKIAFTMVYRAE